MKSRLRNLVVRVYGDGRGAASRFAERLGANSGLVAKWLSNENNRLPGNKWIGKICEVTKADSNWLLSGTGSMFGSEVQRSAASEGARSDAAQIMQRMDVLSQAVSNLLATTTSLAKDVQECRERMRALETGPPGSPRGHGKLAHITAPGAGANRGSHEVP